MSGRQRTAKIGPSHEQDLYAWTRISVGVVACMGVLFVGCSHRYGPESVHDIGRYVTLQPGVSTKQDVYQRFGQPVDVRPHAEGSTWFYVQAATQIHGATFVPFIGMAAGGNTIEITLVTFVFDPTDSYQRVTTSRESRYQNMWVGLAEALQSTGETEARVRAEMTHLGRAFDEAAWHEGKAAQKLR